ncbi:MAG: CopG family transcriptional regulator [Bacillota bacterium]|nr:CopG family transcriptional regulator [Bacillota bacterium]
MAREKHPLQVYLDAQQLEALRALAKKRDTSVAELVRESLSRYLAEVPVSEDPALEIIGLGRSGRGDLSAQHDFYLQAERQGEDSPPQEARGPKDGP